MCKLTFNVLKAIQDIYLHLYWCNISVSFIFLLHLSFTICRSSFYKWKLKVNRIVLVHLFSLYKNKGVLISFRT